MKEIASRFHSEGVSVRTDVSGKALTTFAIGGPIPLLVEPQSVKELSSVLKYIAEAGLSYKIVGAGSNLLIPDEGLDCCMIRLGRGLRKVEIAGARVDVGGATSLMNLSRQTAREGLSGLEFAGGIPASLGGAVFMNAGAHGGEMSSVIESVTIAHPNGEIEELRAADLSFSYRRTALPAPSIVVSARLKLVESSAEQVERKRAENLAYRKATQPLTVPCAGSVFKNPPGESRAAGALLEEAGAKGLCVGGAEVSTLHANWIVNPERLASATDVKEVIAKCQEMVEAAHGIRLHPEVVVW